jgi:aspartate kinase
LQEQPIVLKFGGSSVGSPERICDVAKIIRDHRKNFSKIVVVVSAMGDTTDDLIALATKVSPLTFNHPSNKREMDMLLTSGERVSMALLSMALSDLGVSAISLTGSQTGILTDTVHGQAQIREIRAIRLPEIFLQQKVAIVAGFQGVSLDREITTLGRGGSDTSAVALGVSLGASEVRIYTDVDGVMSADPRYVPSARLCSELDFDTVIEATYRGAQVLHSRCVELAHSFSMPLRVLNTFKHNAEFAQANPKSGTLIKKDVSMQKGLEGPKVNIVSHQCSLVRFEKHLATSEQVHLAISEIRARGLLVERFDVAKNKLIGIAKLELIISASELGLNQVGPVFDSISLVGSGLTAAYDLGEEVLQLIKNEKFKLYEMLVNPLVLEFRLEKSNNSVEALVNKIHSLTQFNCGRLKVPV